MNVTDIIFNKRGKTHSAYCTIVQMILKNKWGDWSQNRRYFWGNTGWERAQKSFLDTTSSLYLVGIYTRYMHIIIHWALYLRFMHLTQCIVYSKYEEGIDHERLFHLFLRLCPTGNGNHQYVY